MTGAALQTRPVARKIEATLKFCGDEGKRNGVKVSFTTQTQNAENLKYLTPDDFSFKHAPKVDFGQCIEDNSFSNIYTFAAHSANAALNVAVGSTGRVGVGGVLPHATTWEHKALSAFGGNASRVGRFAGRAAIVATVFEGFYDIGTIGRCSALAASR